MARHFTVVVLFLGPSIALLARQLVEVPCKAHSYGRVGAKDVKVLALNALEPKWLRY